MCYFYLVAQCVWACVCFSIWLLDKSAGKFFLFIFESQWQDPEHTPFLPPSSPSLSLSLSLSISLCLSQYLPVIPGLIGAIFHGLKTLEHNQNEDQAPDDVNCLNLHIHRFGSILSNFWKEENQNNKKLKNQKEFFLWNNDPPNKIETFLRNISEGINYGMHYIVRIWQNWREKIKMLF